MADYVSALTGPEMDEALYDMASHTSEAWAVGTRNDEPVTSGDPTYNNNSRYWAGRSANYNTNAQAAAARAEAAVPSGTAGAVFFDRAQSLTDAQQAQAKTNIVAGGMSNPNLLFNPWFLVDQRGGATYTGPTTGYDMWRILTGTSMANATNGKKISLAEGYHLNIMQFIPNDTMYNLLGKTITVSIRGNSGIIYSITGTLPSSIASGSTHYFGNIYVGDVAINVRFQHDGEGGYSGYNIRFYTGATAAFDIYVRAIKLELGPMSTLKYDMPPFFMDELRRCQLYLRVIRGISSSGYGFIGRAMSATVAAFYLQAYMASTPSASYTGTPTVNGTAISAVSSSYRNTETVELRVTTTGLTSGSAVQVSVPSGSSIILSAEPALV